MKKYIIVCACFLCIATMCVIFLLSANYNAAYEWHTQTQLEKAIKNNDLYLSQVRQYRYWLLEKYNILPTEKQLAQFGADKFSILKKDQITVTTIGENGHSTAIVNDDIYVTSKLDDNYYLLTKQPLELTEFKNKHVRQAALVCIGTFLLLGTILTVVGIAIYLSKRKLLRAMNAVASGNYDVKIKGGETAKSFNNMATNVNQNVIAANEAAQSQRDFVANFSHELKTPLTAIIGYADLLRSAELDQEDAFTAASYIFSEGKRLESLSLKLMDMIVLDKQEFELKPLPAGKLLQHIAITVRPMLSNALLDLEFHAAAARIEGERDLIITLVMNLLDNARKASEEGNKIILRGTVEGDRYRISIKDNGRGIPKEELNRITEAFYMVDKSRARAQHGAGLGLALSQRIAELHGSSLEFISQPGEGTEVSFTVKRLLKTKELSNED